MISMLQEFQKKLKVIVHRKLSYSDLEKVKQDIQETQAKGNVAVTKDYSIIEGEPQLKVTYEASNSADSDTQIYAPRTITYRYNQDGDLVERVKTREGNIELSRRVEVTQFNPPGSWIGRRILQTDRNHSLSHN